MVRDFARPVALLAGLLIVGVGVGCDAYNKKKEDPRSTRTTTSGTKSLYERLGGEQAISAVVDDFVANAAANPKVNFMRKGHPNDWEPTPENVAKLKRRLVEFIGLATGGPQRYTGRDMTSAHTGMNITEAEFAAIAGDLKASLDKFKVPQREQDELLAIVSTTKDQMVGK